MPALWTAVRRFRPRLSRQERGQRCDLSRSAGIPGDSHPLTRLTPKETGGFSAAERAAITETDPTMTKPLAGKVALATDAGGGVGLGIAAELVDRGAHVASVGRTAATLESADAASNNAGTEPNGHATVFVCDVKDAAAITATVYGVVTTLERIDILVRPRRSRRTSHSGGWIVSATTSVLRSRLDRARLQLAHRCNHSA